MLPLNRPYRRPNHQLERNGSFYEASIPEEMPEDVNFDAILKHSKRTPLTRGKKLNSHHWRSCKEGCGGADRRAYKLLLTSLRLPECIHRPQGKDNNSPWLPHEGRLRPVAPLFGRWSVGLMESELWFLRANEIAAKLMETFSVRKGRLERSAWIRWWVILPPGISLWVDTLGAFCGGDSTATFYANWPAYSTAWTALNIPLVNCCRRLT